MTPEQELRMWAVSAASKLGFKGEFAISGAKMLEAYVLGEAEADDEADDDGILDETIEAYALRRLENEMTASRFVCISEDANGDLVCPCDYCSPKPEHDA
jgi:hypothetical protein